jgi:hypothetical protein
MARAQFDRNNASQPTLCVRKVVLAWGKRHHGFVQGNYRIFSLFYPYRLSTASPLLPRVKTITLAAAALKRSGVCIGGVN